MTLSAQHYHANRLELLSRMAGDISHELKNPLHAMVINLELVRRKIEKGDAAQAIERVAIVEEEIRKVHNLANALLEALRPARDTTVTCNFSGVFDEITPLLAARARCARVDLALESERLAVVVPLAAHEARLILLNLVDRAVRVAAPSGGAIGIGLRPANGHVALDVTSDIPAVDEVEAGWLDDHPVDAEHIDLGLRVVRDLVARSGGRISRGSVAGGRNRLSVTLPPAASA